MSAPEERPTPERTQGGMATVILAGVLGGLVGTAAFGAVSDLIGLGFVRSFIPSIFGLEQSGVVGWAIHLATGAVLGLVFALIVSRDVVADLLVPHPEEPQLGPISMVWRMTAAGVAYGLAVWALLPMLSLPLWLGSLGTEAAVTVPGTATQTLAAHLVFGTLLGFVYGEVVSRR